MVAYREAGGPLRWQFNLAFFKRLLIDDDYTVTGELAEPFDALLGPELRRAVAVRTSETLQDAIAGQQRQRATEGVVIENEQHPREPRRPLVGAGSTTDFSFGGGFTTEHLVRMRGLEPPRTYIHTDLNRARLPIPPHPRDAARRYRNRGAAGRVGEAAGERTRRPVEELCGWRRMAEGHPEGRYRESCGRGGPVRWAPTLGRIARSAGSDESRPKKALLPALSAASRFASLGCCAYEPPSSRGLGRRPLTAVTRVRIPLAV